MKNWILVTDRYEGIRKRAVNMLAGYVSGLISSALSVKYADEVTEEELAENHLIAVGRVDEHPLLAAYAARGLIEVPTAAEGYALFVGRAGDGEEGYTVAIAGTDDRGVLYGCMHFINGYCGDRLHKSGYLFDEGFFRHPLERALPDLRVSTAPAIPVRGIWTWGHVIYDYRGFLDNMARLRLNEVIIWNDCLPFNAEDVVKYAHGLGIRVIWGFAWGWVAGLDAKVEEILSDEGLKKIRENVLTTYRTQYADSGADGIYFQSITELRTDTVNGRCIAEVVTDLVNDIAGELLAAEPDLHIQFGLHATSVKEHLDTLRRVDPRLHILWEDCGAFPYHYSPEQVGNFEETYRFTEELLTLRGSEERFGAVLKGMTNLDWNGYRRYPCRQVIGERDRMYIEERQTVKDKIWKLVTAGWLKNAEYAQRTLAQIADGGRAPVVAALSEDGMLENKIALPVAIYAEMLWDPHAPLGQILEKAMKHPFVER